MRDSLPVVKKEALMDYTDQIRNNYKQRLKRNEKRSFVGNTKGNKRLFGYRISDKILDILDELSKELNLNKNQVIDAALLDYYSKIKHVL